MCIGLAFVCTKALVDVYVHSKLSVFDKTLKTFFWKTVYGLI